MCGVMLFRSSFPSILEGLQRREIGLWGVLLGFRMGMILASFQMLGMLLVVSERLKMSVRALMACRPICLRCK